MDIENKINSTMVEFINKHEWEEGWDFQDVIWLKQFADDLKKELGGR